MKFMQMLIHLKSSVSRSIIEICTTIKTTKASASQIIFSNFEIFISLEVYLTIISVHIIH